MKNKLMMGLWRYMLGVPPFMWEKQIAKGKRAPRCLQWVTPVEIYFESC
ncbi:MAG: hypothetical protein V1844_23665 [Pseudomonadota bacterium]